MLRLSLLTSVAPFLLSIANAQGTVTITGTSTTVTCTRYHQTGFWDVDIDNWPALPPECGPPLSFNAVRDKSKLPAQICGIVGSYIFFLVAIGTLLLTWGKRMRKNAESSTGTLKEIEMVNASKYGLSSPAPSHMSWMKAPFRKKKGMSDAGSTKMSAPTSPNSNYPQSPGMESINSFDNRVLQTDRESRQAEMDRLYAAVMAHEEAKRSQTRISRVQSVDSLRSGSEAKANSDVISASPPKPAPSEGRKNLRVQISEVPSVEIPPNGPGREAMPKSPYRAIYPPYPSPGPRSGMPMTPATPFSPGRVELPNDMYPASPPPKNLRMQLPNQVAPPRSSGQDSSNSAKSRKLGLKNLRISGPSPYNQDDAEEREPLSPRIPQNPPAPPAPPGYNEPLTGESDLYASERLDEPKPLPSSQPSRPIPTPLALPSSPAPNRQTPNAGSQALPLRAYTSQESLPTNPLSPGPVKTTILERKPDPRIGRGPMTGRTPRTGVPMTPYTPYMPYTPITPVTPGLLSKKERKERIKAEGRKVLVEEDEVKDDDEMWGN